MLRASQPNKKQSIFLLDIDLVNDVPTENGSGVVQPIIPFGGIAFVLLFQMVYF